MEAPLLLFFPSEIARTDAFNSLSLAAYFSTGHFYFAQQQGVVLL